MTIPPSRFIAFTGRAQSGKSTAAKFLEARGYQKLSFAEPIKRMLQVLTFEKDKHAKPAVLCGKAIREAYQTLGTEWGRRLIGEDIWARYMLKQVDTAIGDFLEGDIQGIVIDDCRFDNEAEMLSAAGATIIRVTRSGEEVMDHESEKGVSEHLIHHAVENNGDLDEYGLSILAICGLA